MIQNRKKKKKKKFSWKKIMKKSVTPSAPPPLVGKNWRMYSFVLLIALSKRKKYDRRLRLWVFAIPVAPSSWRPLGPTPVALHRVARQSRTLIATQTFSLSSPRSLHGSLPPTNYSVHQRIASAPACAVYLHPHLRIVEVNVKNFSFLFSFYFFFESMSFCFKCVGRNMREDLEYCTQTAYHTHIRTLRQSENRR